MLDSPRHDSARLDSTRLRAELFFIHRELSRMVATHCMNMLDDLHTEVAGASVLIWRSLLSDCLRVVYCVTMADGRIYDYELERIRDLVSTAARHYTGTRDSPYDHRAPVDAASTHAFLHQYAQDSGPFGYGAAVRWRGHVLCLRADAAGNREPLHRYARLMWWLIEETCKISNVSLDDPRWHGRLSDIDELRQTLTGTGFGPSVEVDRRVQVFVSGAGVFTPVEQALSVYEADPFDVEMLHSEARASFRQLVRQATTDSRHTNSGRTLLLIGDSGAGKTHLLRSFWSHVQEYGRGFVAYAQMHANVDDYTRYFLHQIVESLKCPYSGSHGGRTGLHELAWGLVRLKGEDFAARVARLAELLGDPRGALDRQVNHLVDELLGHTALAGFHPDLLRVLLYALCLDPKTTPRVYQYLRCDNMNDHDRSLIGNVIPLTTSEDAREMIHKLAHLAFVTRSAALVLMIDQVDLSGLDSNQAMATFQRAVDVLLGIASEVRSVIVVIACLSNLYDKVLKVIGRPTLDRLEKDPAPARLSSNLSYDEIKAIVGHRLAWVFAAGGAVYRTTDPMYPIPEAQLRNLVNRRPRDILEWCHQFHERCVKAGKIVEIETVPAGPPLPVIPPVPPPPLPPIDRIAAAWNDAYEASRVSASLTDAELLALVTTAARAYAVETGVSVAVSAHKDNLLRLQLSTEVQRIDLLVSVTNRAPAAGAFGAQIRKLRHAARAAIAVAVRTDEFPNGAASAKAVKQLTDAGGRTACLDKATLRALVAYKAFKPEFPAEHIEAWKRSKRPISSLQSIAAMFGFNPHHQPSAPALAGNGAAAGTTGDIPAGTTVPPPAARAAVQRAAPQVRAAGR